MWRILMFEINELSFISWYIWIVLQNSGFLTDWYLFMGGIHTIVQHFCPNTPFTSHYWYVFYKSCKFPVHLDSSLVFSFASILICTFLNLNKFCFIKLTYKYKYIISSLILLIFILFLYVFNPSYLILEHI